LFKSGFYTFAVVAAINRRSGSASLCMERTDCHFATGPRFTQSTIPPRGSGALLACPDGIDALRDRVEDLRARLEKRDGFATRYEKFSAPSQPPLPHCKSRLAQTVAF
jgi:hypothetical protein